MAMGKMYKAPRAKVNKAVKAYVKNTIRSVSETKYKYHLWTNQLISSTGTNKFLCHIAQGETPTERNGNQVRVTGWHGKLNFRPNQTQTVVAVGKYMCTVRCIIYIPKDTSNVIAGLDIRAEVDTDKFNVLGDTIHNVVFQDTRNQQLTLRKKFGQLGRVQQYSSPASVDVTKFNPQMYLVSDQGTGSEQATIDGHMKVYFKDI